MMSLDELDTHMRVAAFDHVRRLLVQKDGPMLEALKRLDGATIHLPPRDRDRPDRDRLAQRFERFRAAA